MIEVQEVLQDLPHFETFCSVSDLSQLAASLEKASPRVTVEVAGTSVNGLPIHHIRFGKGSAKALVTGFPHCHEPVGGMTVLSLMRLLEQGHPQLNRLDVEWHIVPCIDPDGALLNESWTQQPFTFANYMRKRHVQSWLEQVDCSFPIAYKKLHFDQPSKEAAVLKSLLEQIRPDYFFSLHNSIAAGGAWYPISRDIDSMYYSELHGLREEYGIPLQATIAHEKWCRQFAPGIYEMFSVTHLYDDLERTLASPENYLQMGGASWDYLQQLNPQALVFVAELPHVKYPRDAVREETRQNVRRLKLHLDAENKFLLTAILEEWDKVAESVDSASPFYRKTVREIVSLRDKLVEGVPLTLGASTTRELLFNPAYGKTATRAQLIDIHIGDRFNVLCHSYEFVSLLKASRQTTTIRAAINRLDTLFDEALSEVDRNVGFDACEVLDCDTLARVQLGSGLIALNAVLEARGA